MSSVNQQFDIVIVGGGMVGATMAALLKALPVKIALLDRGSFDSPRPAPDSEADEVSFDARVSALTLASRQLLEQLGVWQAVMSQRCCPYQTMDVWDAEGTGSVAFSAADIDQDELGIIVENRVLLQALYDKLREQDNLELIPGQLVTALQTGPDEGVQLQCESGQVIQASLLIAADGANSGIRRLAQFKTREWDYQHSALVTTVRSELPHGGCARQRFMASGPLAFLPLHSGRADDEQRYCSIVWSSNPQMTEELMQLDDTEFAKKLGRAFEWRLGQVEHCAPRYSFPLRQRHAVDYVHDNIVLIGDAAHSIHPLAGQGVNLGLLDARALARELEQAQAAGRAPGDSTVLLRYQRARKGHNLGMMWLMEGFKHLFAQEALPIRWLRNAGLRSVDKAGFIKNQLARRAMGLDWD
jgi:2-octaprenylphenol hydroxylase